MSTTELAVADPALPAVADQAAVVLATKAYAPMRVIDATAVALREVAAVRLPESFTRSAMAHFAAGLLFAVPTFLLSAHREPLAFDALAAVLTCWFRAVILLSRNH